MQVCVVSFQVHRVFHFSGWDVWMPWRFLILQWLELVRCSVKSLFCGDRSGNSENSELCDMIQESKQNDHQNFKNKQSIEKSKRNIDRKMFRTKNYAKKCRKPIKNLRKPMTTMKSRLQGAQPNPRSQLGPREEPNQATAGNSQNPKATAWPWPEFLSQ